MPKKTNESEEEIQAEPTPAFNVEQPGEEEVTEEEPEKKGGPRPVIIQDVSVAFEKMKEEIYTEVNGAFERMQAEYSKNLMGLHERTVKIESIVLPKKE